MLFFTLAIPEANAQVAAKVRVLDYDTQTPIPGVNVISRQPFNLIESRPFFVFNTDLTGTFELNRGWFDRDTFAFYKNGYLSLKITMGEIRRKGYRVFLQKSIRDQHEQKDGILMPGLLAGAGSDPEILISEELERFPAASLGEYFRSGMQVYAPAKLPGGGEPRLLGLSQVYQELDGYRLIPTGNAGGESRQNPGLAPWHFEKVDAWIGPQGVRRGSEAIGGAILLSGPKLDIARDSKSESSGKLGMGYEEGFDRAWAGFRFLHKRKNLALMTSVYGVQSQQFRSGKEKLRAADWKNLQIWQKASIFGKRYLNHHFSGFISAIPQLSNAAAYGMQDGGIPVYSQNDFQDQTHSFLGYTLEVKESNDLFDRAELKLSYQDSRRQQAIIREDSPAFRELFRERQQAADVNLNFYKLAGNRSFFSYGLGINQDRGRGEAYIFSDTAGFGVQTLPGLADGGAVLTRSFGWIQHRLSLSPHLSSEQGLRFDHQSTRVKYENVENLEYLPNEYIKGSNALAWDARLLYRIDRKFKTSLGFASGYRFANSRELGLVYSSTPGRAIAPNELMQPEYNSVVDVHVDYTLKDLQIRAKTYFNALRKGLGLAPDTWLGQDSLWLDGVLSRVYSLRNQGKANIYGARLHLRWDPLPGLRAEARLGGSYGREAGSGEVLDWLPPVFGRIGLMYRKSGFQTDLAWRFAGSKEGRNSWNALDLRLMYAFGRGLLLQIQVENVLNEEYALFGAAIPEIGRNLGASLVLRW